jgi:hypothetical protein
MSMSDRSKIEWTTGPECCGTPMVKMSYYDVWECADAFFCLYDDDVLVEGSIPLGLNDRANDYHRELLEHLNETMVGADAHLLRGLANE